MGGNSIRFIIFITLHIGKSGEVGGFSFFYYTDGKIEMAEGIFPTSWEKKFHIKIIYLKFVECKKNN